MTSPILEHLAKYRPEDAKKALLEAIAEKYRHSLYLTAKDLFGFRDMTWRTHGPIIEALEAPTLRKLVVVPRGCFKSSLCTVTYPCWRLMSNFNLRTLIDSEVYENSKNFITEIKGKLEDERVVKIFGEFKSDTKWSEGAITIRQRNKVWKEPSVVASGANANKTSQHYDLIIHDDMNSDKNSGTPDARKKIINHCRMNTSILEPTGTMVYVGTRYAADDILGWIMDTELNPK